MIQSIQSKSKGQGGNQGGTLVTGFVLDKVEPNRMTGLHIWLLLHDKPTAYYWHSHSFPN
jgi:hypothetical protein